MVKSPKIRHSQPRRDPVTIDLEASDVIRDAAPNTEKTTAPMSDASPEPKPADKSPVRSTPPIPGADKPLLDEQPPAAGKPAEPATAARPDERSRPAFGREPPQSTPKAEPKPEPKPEKPAAATPSASASSARPPAARGGMSMIAAGLVGGIVALAGGGALQYAGLVPSPGATGGDSAALAALQSDVAALKDRPAAAADPADAQALGALSERVDTVVATVDQMKADLAAAASTSGAPSPAAAQALDERFKALETAIAALPATGGDATALEEKLATLETGLAAAVKAAEDDKAAAEVADAASLARLATLEETVAGLAGKVAEQAEQPNAALAIAASTLKAAIDRGDPFMTELETFAAVSPDSAEIAPLRDMAASGVPSRTAIAAGFPDAAAAMIAAARSADPDAGILDRLMSSAQSLVQVRPVGMVEGADVPAIVARMEVALNKGDYAAALKEHEALPPAAKAAGASYMATVQARLAADELTTKVLSAALKA